MTLRIRTKLIISFSTIVALLSVLILLTYYNRNLLWKGMFRLEEAIYETYIVSSVQLNIDRVLMPPNDYLITGEPGEKVKFQMTVEEVETGFGQLEGLTNNGYNPHIQEAKGKFILIKEIADAIFAIENPVGDKRGAQLMKAMDVLASDIVTNHLNKVHLDQRSQVAKLIVLADINQKRVDTLIVAGALVSIITVSLLVLYLIRAIVRPILLFKEGAFIIRSGNLDHRINIKDGMEINLLADEFNKMAGSLKESYADLERKVEDRTKELNELNLKLNEISITDGLTGIYNHMHFYDRLTDEVNRAVRYGRPLSVIMADIDYFKHYNDTNGHIEGDHVLKEIASCIRRNVRDQDIVARYGGEEFAIVLPETGKEGVLIIAGRIREYLLNQTFPHEEKQPGGKLTMSFGVAAFPDDADDPKRLMEMADKALYRAKKNGRNRVEVYETALSGIPHPCCDTTDRQEYHIC